MSPTRISRRPIRPVPPKFSVCQVRAELAKLIAEQDEERMKREADFIKALQSQYMSELGLIKSKSIWTSALLLTLAVTLFLALRLRNRLKNNKEIQTDLKEWNQWLNSLFPRPSEALVQLEKTSESGLLKGQLVVSIRLQGAHDLDKDTHPFQWMGFLDRLFQEWDKTLENYPFEKVGASGDTYWLLALEQCPVERMKAFEVLFRDMQESVTDLSKVLPSARFHLTIVADQQDVFCLDNNAFGFHVASDAMHDLDRLHNLLSDSGLLLSEQVCQELSNVQLNDGFTSFEIWDLSHVHEEYNRKKWVFIPL